MHSLLYEQWRRKDAFNGFHVFILLIANYIKYHRQGRRSVVTDSRDCNAKDVGSIVNI